MDEIEIKTIFEMFDKNGDGQITKLEMSESLENLAIFIPDEDLSQMIHKVNHSRDDSVDMSEFSELYRSLMGDKDEEEDMMEAFNVFDQNGDGYISVDELRSVLFSLGQKDKTEDDCKKMIMKVDMDGDGRVNFMEFKQMMKGGNFTALA